MNRRLERIPDAEVPIFTIEDIREELLLAIEHPDKFVLFKTERNLHPDPERALRTHSLRWKVLETFDDAMGAASAYIERPESDKVAVRYTSHLDEPGPIIDMGEVY
ncbi:MAG TPA: hypothetical protein VHA78_01810 [Candidatus Peribacteraceae bacterium]|nr:hypothetical protein [Candidatus Peribacteraceae bacterium]